MSFRASLTEPNWPVEPGRTREVIAGYYVDWTGARPTDTEVLAVVAPTAQQLIDQAKAAAKDLFDQLDAMMRLHRAEIGLMVDEINLLRQRLRAQDAAVAGAGSLAALKTAWAALAAVPDRTDDQARAALRNRIDAQA